jgi:hypothetical protein
MFHLEKKKIALGVGQQRMLITKLLFVIPPKTGNLI